MINARWPRAAVAALQQVEREMPDATAAQKAERLAELYPDPRNDAKAVKNKIEKLSSAARNPLHWQDWRTLELPPEPDLFGSTGPAGGAEAGRPAQALDDATADGKARCVVTPPAGRIMSVDDLLAAANVDPAEWEVERAKVNKYEAGCKVDIIDPETLERVGQELSVTPLFQVQAWLKRPPAFVASTRRLWQELLDDLRREADLRERLYAALPAVAEGDRYVKLLGMYDTHIGKRGEYGSRETELVWAWVRRKLYQKASGYAPTNVCIAASEFLHTEDGRSTTAGTPQDSDISYRQMWRRAVRMLRDTAEAEAASAHVDLVIEPGNHARRSEWCMGELLAAVYDGHPRISIHNEGPRQYREYGQVLLGFTHGNEERHADLPGIMADEQREAWGRTLWHEWVVGHLHTKRKKTFMPVDERRGCHVRTLSAISPTDDWHRLKGYQSVKAGEALIYSFTTGYETHIAANITGDMVAELKRSAAGLAVDAA